MRNIRFSECFISKIFIFSVAKGPSATYKPTWERANQNTFHRAEAERLAAERLLEEAKALIEDAKIRVDKDEIEVESVSEKIIFIMQ